jgi:DNA-binding SARP family transcriptional activator
MMSQGPVDLLVPPAVREKIEVLHLFGGPFVRFGARRAEIPEGSQRLLVFVALRRGAVDRRHAAGILWPDGTDTRAAGNLRSALWRLNNAGISLIRADKYRLVLRDDVFVDLRIINDWAGRLIDGSASGPDLGVIPWNIQEFELLPGWYDDWALLERERVTQRMLHGMEMQIRRLIQHGRCAEAVEVALVATGADPLRESAQQSLIEAYLAEGNWAEAHRRFESYRLLVRDELGIQPGVRLSALVQPDTFRDLPYPALAELPIA